MQLQSPLSESERQTFCEIYERNRKRSSSLFDLIHADAYEEQPIALRHPFVFYEGHIPGFGFLALVRFALGGVPIDETLERLFQRGIDPDSPEEARASGPSAWPKRSQVVAFANQCDARVHETMRNARLDDPENPRLLGAEAVHTILEHEQMHQETLLYILHQLDFARKKRVLQSHQDRPRVASHRVHVDAGIATLGAVRGTIPFGWDNEFDETRVSVDAFEIDVDSVTNEDFLAFVEAGGDVPPFWRKCDGEWRLLTQFDLLPLPQSWPVYVTHEQATAYAAWKGMRLPTEAEYHRAAFGTPEGKERIYPWGDALPDATRGNFGFARYDPVPVGSYPRGASAWGVNDLVGNAWEWTSTVFQPFAGFSAMASYPVYSQDFFDGKHYVLKGASPVTDLRLIRKSFRNWFRADYRYVYAKFRCVS